MQSSVDSPTFGVGAPPVKLLELGNSIGGTEERLAENSRSIYGSGGGSGRKSSAREG